MQAAGCVSIQESADDNGPARTSSEPKQEEAVFHSVPRSFPESDPLTLDVPRKPSKFGRRRQNLLVELAKPVVGGIIGLLIAQLILWWLPGDWRRDPFGLATQLPRYLDFLAPEALRRSTPDGARTTNVLPGGNPDIDLSRVGINRPDASPDASSTATDAEQPLESDRPVASSGPIGLSGVPVLSYAEFDAALRQARAMDASVDSSVNPQTDKRAQQQFYVHMAELARNVTFLDRGTPEAAEGLRSAEEFLESIAASPLKLKILGVGAAGWINYKARPTTGIAFAGTVRQIDRQGNTYETKVELAGRPGSFLDILSQADPREDPRARFEIGDMVVVLAIIVDDPASQVAGYTGNLPLATWSGLHVVVSQSAQGTP
jgi:hypothetical protein